MGVDYSTTVGYGIVLEGLPSFMDVDDFEPEIDKWLKENKFEHIEFHLCGDWMSGEFVYLFAVKGTVNHVDTRYSEGYVSFDEPTLTPEAGREVVMLCDALGLSWPIDVAWKLIFNVS